MIACPVPRTAYDSTMRSALRPGLNTRRGGILISRDTSDDKENFKPVSNRTYSLNNSSSYSSNPKTQAQRDILDSYRSARAVHHLQKADIFKLVNTNRSGSATGRKSSGGSGFLSNTKKPFETQPSPLHRSLSMHSNTPIEQPKGGQVTLQEKIKRKLSGTGLERVEWTQTTIGSQIGKSPANTSDLFFGTECSDDHNYRILNSYYDESPQQEEQIAAPKLGESMVTIKEVEEKDEAPGYSSRKSGDIQASFKNLLDRYCKDVSVPNLVPATETKHPPGERAESPREERVQRLELQLKKLLNAVENNPSRRNFSRGNGWEPFRKIEGVEDAERLKRTIREMEIDKREREAELIQMNMQLQDLGRIAHELLRAAKSSSSRKGWAL